MKNVAEAFSELQELRHDADYNRTRAFTKSDAREVLDSVEDAFRDWDQVRATPVAGVFLVLLLLGERWNRN
ncbi:MAG: hypothetical protein K2V38_08735 [Gemmataceae bacterium]|nr:hypothetical protein [Gemmataceae bacterium]